MVDVITNDGGLGLPRRYRELLDGERTYYAEETSVGVEIDVDVKEEDIAAITDAIAAPGTAGTPSADVLTVQGDADGTPVPVSEPDTAPASGGEAVDISAADHTCARTTRALYVGGYGTVVATVGGADLTFLAVPGGSLIPIAATVIKDTSTATDMVALW